MRHHCSTGGPRISAAIHRFFKGIPGCPDSMSRSGHVLISGNDVLIGTSRNPRCPDSGILKSQMSRFPEKPDISFRRNLQMLKFPKCQHVCVSSNHSYDIEIFNRMLNSGRSDFAALLERFTSFSDHIHSQ